MTESGTPLAYKLWGQELSSRLGGTATLIVPRVASKNVHFLMNGAAGPTDLFVKVMCGNPRYFGSELAATDFLSAHNIRHPRVHSSGKLFDDTNWIAYHWLTLKSLDGHEPALVDDAARLLGSLHRQSQGWSDARLRQLDDLPRLALESIRKVAELDSDIGGRLARLYPACLERWPADAGGPACLIHGDFGLRNMAMVPSGEIILFDFEHASIGPAILEFAKVWDRELSSARCRGRFLAHYTRASGFSTASWGHACFLVRLWAAAGVFPYARLHQDREFEEHGLSVVQRLEFEISHT